MSPPGMHLGQIVVYLVVATICLSELRDLLPRVAPAIVALGVVFIVVRLVLFHTRRW